MGTVCVCVCVYSLLQVERDGRPGDIGQHGAGAVDGRRGERRYVFGRQSAQELPGNVAVGVRRIRVN